MQNRVFIFLRIRKLG